MVDPYTRVPRGMDKSRSVQGSDATTPDQQGSWDVSFRLASAGASLELRCQCRWVVAGSEMNHFETLQQRMIATWEQ